ncbi:B3 domain-containing transcription factor [Sarracenia purpurea var. burkii]
MKDLNLDGVNQHAGEEESLEDMVDAREGGMSIPSRFVSIKEEDEVMDVGDGEIWLERQEEDLLDVNETSIFYNDFPPIPDFPCMSSSSSSSSIPAPAKPIASSSSASSSSSAASWAVLKSDAEDFVEKSNNNHHNQPVQFQVQVYKHDQAAAQESAAAPAALSSTASMEFKRPPPEDSVGNVDCMDVMENFGYMELIDSNEIWDPSSIFQSENPQEYQQLPQPQPHEESLQQNQQLYLHQQQENDVKYAMSSGNNAAAAAVHEQRPPTDDLGVVFFEWLKSNKEFISAEDMRSIKLRRATVESASKRLGGTKEGRKQLLKLILEWVEQYQLQKKRLGEAAPQFPFQYQEPFQNPNPNPNLTCNSMPPNINSYFLPSQWIQTQPPPPYVTDPTSVMGAPTAFPAMGAYSGGDPYLNSASVPPTNQNINGHPHYSPPTEYQMLDSAQTWPPSQYALASQYSPFPDNNGNIPAAAPTATHHPQAFAGYQYPYQYYQGNGEKLVRLGSSATKEARKKRMARQKRFISHHRHHHHHQNHQNQNQNQNQNPEQQASFGGENCTNAAQASPATWVYWPSAASPVSSTVPMVPENPPLPHTTADHPPIHGENCQQRQVSSDRRQVGFSSSMGWKPDQKNLKFLLQKVLKQSDVGNLGRIVLPKKEAETHLPELEARDGIPIAMEDIGTSRVWNMRYRFWPNNKSRMYLLENTGDFVRANGLQEGDFIVIYSDVKCGKYLIRGVKVRQSGPKSEVKKPAKSHKNLRTAPPAAGSGSSYQPSQKSE